MFSKMLNIYVMLLAILGILIASGLVHIVSKIEFEILKPAYTIDLKGLDPSNGMYGNISLDELLNVLTDSGDVDLIIVDRPETNSANFRKQRLVTDGYKVFSCWFALWSDAVLAYQLFPEISQPPHIEILPLESREDKRIAVNCALQRNLRLTLEYAKKKSITTDSLFKLTKSLPSNYLIPLFKQRMVYNFISINNLSDCKAEDIVVRIVEPGRLILGGPPSIELIGWTLPDGSGAIPRISGDQLEFELPILREKGSVQLLIKTKSARIEERDVFFEYSKVKSLNKKLVVRWLVIMALASILIYFIESGLCKNIVGNIRKSLRNETKA